MPPLGRGGKRRHMYRISFFLERTNDGGLGLWHVLAMAAPLALIFDVDGTLADTESAHRQAFNQAFAEEGLPFTWSEPEYIRLLAVSGGKERLGAFFHEMLPAHPEHPTLREAASAAGIDRLHARKTRIYEKLVGQGQVPLRPGVLRLFHQARDAGLPLCLATTTTPANIDALLRTPLGPDWRGFFTVVADAATAPRKKPDPQVYLHVLAALRRDPADCLAFEDSQNGLRAARAAGLPTIVTPTAFTVGDDFAGALRVWPDLGSVQLAELYGLGCLY